MEPRARAHAPIIFCCRQQEHWLLPASPTTHTSNPEAANCGGAVPPGYPCDFFPIPLPPARVCWTLGEAQSRRVGRRGTCNSCPARQTSISPRVSSREAPHSLRPHPARVPRAKVKRRSLPRQKPETLEFTSGCPQRPIATSQHFRTRSASSHP